MTPLAQSRERRHFTFMNKIVFILWLVGSLSVCDFCAQNSFAQTLTPSQEKLAEDDIPAPELEGPIIEVPKLPLPKSENEGQERDTQSSSDFKAPPKSEAGKDLTVRSEEGRAKMLHVLFLNLKNAPDEEAAKFIAEEIWAVFLQSGSASVDFALLRGISAQSRGDKKLARRMFDHVLRLQPEYAEGWARSGRLAIEEDDLNRAISDIQQTLVIEPRHFYALWTLGNILEKLGRSDAAFEAYLEAYKLYPEHKEIKDRVENMRETIRGKAL